MCAETELQNYAFCLAEVLCNGLFLLQISLIRGETTLEFEDLDLGASEIYWNEIISRMKWKWKLMLFKLLVHNPDSS